MSRVRQKSPLENPLELNVNKGDDNPSKEDDESYYGETLVIQSSALEV